MTGLGLAARYARRELRGGLAGFRLFVACLAIGVAAIAAVGTVSEAVVGGLRADGRSLLGGDVELRLLHRPATAAQEAYLADNAAALSKTVEMRAMARRADGGSDAGRADRAMIELKAVDAVYPLVGRVVLDGGVSLADALARRDGVFGAAADPGLLDRLGLDVGDRVRTGEATFEVRARLVKEPDRVASILNFGPRLMIAAEALDETGLVQPGSLIRYYSRVALAPGADVAAWTEALKQAFPTAGWRLRDVSEAAPGVRRFVERMALFLGFVGMTALLVGGIGVANAVNSYLDGKTATIATLKCLGAPGATIFQTYLLQVAAMAVLGAVVGMVAGAALPALALAALDGRLPVSVAIGVYPGPLALAGAFGLLTAVTFALWPLARAREVAPGSLFRDVVQPARGRPRRRYVVLLALSAAALAGLVVATASDRGFAWWFVGGSVATLVALRLGAQAMMAISRRLPRPASSAWRLALANLHRPGAPTPSVVLSLGTGMAVLVAVALIENNLAAQIRDRLPEQAPAFFFVDIQSAQADAFDATIEGAGARDFKRVPSLRGRIVRIKGVPVEEATIAPEAGWAVRGDRGLTYAAEVPDNADIVAGTWWPRDYDGPPVVSMDAGVARGLGVGVGDTVTLNVLGREIVVRIASLREIDWGEIPFDFVFIFAPGTLEAAPHTHIAAAYATPAAEDAVERAVTDRFANVTAIRVREALEAANRILAGVGEGVRASATITLVAGGLVLAGAIAAGRRQRVYDAVVFKVLGATRGRIAGAFVIEYGLLGLATGVIAAAVGTLTAWGIVVFLMRAEWAFAPEVAATTVLACIVVAQAMGFAGTWRALGEKAGRHLRNE